MGRRSMLKAMLFGFPKAQSAGIAALLLVLTVCAAATASPDAAALRAIHGRLQDYRALARQRGAIFVAEISKIESIPHASCKSGVEHRVAYHVVEVLWDEPDSLAQPGYIVSKGFVDCREKPLDSPPFAVGVKVLLYCGKLDGYSCLPPAQYSDENLHTVQTWLDQLRAEEGDPALLQVHEHLLQSAELLRKVPAGRPVVTNGELSRPFVFTGQVKSIEPPRLQGPTPMSVGIRRYMEITVSKVLWGDFKDPVVHAWCNSPKCGGAQPDETVILHCYATRSFAQCSPPSSYSEEKLKKVESWVAEQSRN